MEFRVLASRGVGGYRQYRIPALGRTPAGRLIAVYDGRPDLDDLPSPVDLVMRTSDDDGRTWSEQVVLRRSEGLRGFGDASVIIDPSVGAQGRILVMAQSTQLAGFFESPLGVDEDDPMIAQVVLSQSDDNGVTWVHRVITGQVKDEISPGIFSTSGTGGRIPTGPLAGRLLQTFVLRRDGELLAALGFSDDHGETWALGALIPGGNESAAVGLADGSILLHSRSTPHRLVGRSLDGGLTLTSLSPDVALPDPSDNGSLLAHSSGAVLCTHNHDGDLRRNTVVKRSHDGGHTWPEAVVIEHGSSAYSTCCELGDGSVGVLFERHGYTELVFCRIGWDEFRPISEALPEPTGAQEPTLDVILRYVRPARIADEHTFLVDSTGRDIPPSDMSKVSPAARKEVGNADASAADRLYTMNELDVLFGPVHPGLIAGDELRFSGRLWNHAPAPLCDVEVLGPDGTPVACADVLEPGARLVFQDVRTSVTEEQFDSGSVHVTFEWRGKRRGDDGALRLAGAVVSLALAVSTGLPQEA